MLMGHSTFKVTMDIYGHLMDDHIDDTADMISKMILSGHSMVTTCRDEDDDDLQVVDLMVAGGGIEPPTRGFSILCSTD